MRRGHSARLWTQVQVASKPRTAYETFARWFEALDRRGLLSVSDPALAAQHFNWLILSIPLNEAMARPVDDSAAAEDDLHRYADKGVRVFLAAYGAPAPRPDPGPSAATPVALTARDLSRRGDPPTG